MCTYVYLLSFYGEHGAECVRATLDRGKLHAIIDAYELKGPVKRDEYHKALDYALSDGDEALAALDEALYEGSGANPTNLSDGWGGMQLHVVRLE